MRSRMTFSVLLGVSCLLTAAYGRAAASPAATPADPSTLGVLFGRYDPEEIQRQLNDGHIERLELTNTREIIRSYRVEVVELRRGPGRAHLSIFGEVTSTFSVDPQNDPRTGHRQLVAVEVRQVSLDQFGSPLPLNSQTVRARRQAGGWVVEQADGVPLDEYAGSLTPVNRRALFTLTGLLRAAPGQPAVAWHSDLTEQAVQLVVSSLLPLAFTKIPVIPIFTDLALGGASDKVSALVAERFKSRELRWGAGGTISESSVADNASLYRTLGERVWTDPRGFQAGCGDLPGDWKVAASRALSVHRACLAKGPPLPVSCTQSLASFAGDVFGVYDFYNPASPSEMSPDEILSFVSGTPSRWELLGNASDESVRLRAQETSNAGVLVLAIRRGDSAQTDAERKHTKVAFILPGQVVLSASWGGRVPNSATLATASVAEPASYVGKSLAYAFANATNVRLYARLY